MKKLLIADDVPRILECMIEAFGQDYTVLTARDGEEALRIFSGEAPDAVILDADFPGALQGLDILKRMKELAPDRPVLMVTGRVDLKEKLLSAGADGFFEKPCSVESIRTFLSEKVL